MTAIRIVPSTTEPGEVVSLGERLGRLQLLRIAFVAVVLTGAWLSLRVDSDVQRDLVTAGAGYLMVVTIGELLRRRRSRRSSLTTLSALLLVDGVYLAFVTYLTGGTQSPLRFLLFVHLVAVTLLASYRTGLKIALWHSLLSMVVLYAQAAQLVPVRESAPGALPVADGGIGAIPIFNVTAFWVVALVTAAFSSLNERELRRRRADADALASMATEMEELRRPEEIADSLLSWLTESFGFRRGVVLATDDGVAVLAENGAAALSSKVEAIDEVVARAWDARGPVLVKRVDKLASPVLAELLPDAERVLVLPLFSENQLLGAVAVEHGGASAWRIERRVVLAASQFAAYAALALRNAWLLAQTQRMADTDGLTGVPNRRMFDLTITREVERARREEGCVSLLLLDLDHFKAYNDEHGHLAGDEALKMFGRTLVTQSRASDLVARYGGEEFAVVLPNCTADEALRMGERVCRSVRELRGPAPLTVSVGAATFPVDGQTAEDLVHAADSALYASKRGGRDRVERPQTPDTPVPA
jgi:two-component system, cell cycle response regulator